MGQFFSCLQSIKNQFHIQSYSIEQINLEQFFFFFLKSIDKFFSSSQTNSISLDNRKWNSSWRLKEILAMNSILAEIIDNKWNDQKTKTNT